MYSNKAHHISLLKATMYRKLNIILDTKWCRMANWFGEYHQYKDHFDAYLFYVTST